MLDLDIDRTLRKIVSNLSFEWNSDVHLLFRSISPYAWGLFRRNLYRFLKAQDDNPLRYRWRLTRLLINTDFLELFQKVEASYLEYMKAEDTIVSRRYPELKDETVAYFSMEYGIDVLRTYSGGLGILSGDHLRGASDVGLKMVGVGLFYMHGYYEQQIAMDGTMKVSYEAIVPPKKRVRDYLPLELLKKQGSAEELTLMIPMSDRKVKIRVWRVKIGRVDLVLLDSNLTENGVRHRHITRRLYASQKHHEDERRRRLEQEIVLGIGGVHALAAAGYAPKVYHLNEGHVAFALLEIIRRLMKDKSMSFDAARAYAASYTGFTTHTPVPEGNERFDEGLVREYLEPYLNSFLKPQEMETIFNMARNSENAFDMTKLSLLLSGVFRGGVSALHGEVCRDMWAYCWSPEELNDGKAPIGSITNAVHAPYWQKPGLRRKIEEVGGIDNVKKISDKDVWGMHLEFKAKLIEKVQERYAYQLLRENSEAKFIHDKTKDLLDLDAFMIGFARRFAGYKRVTLLLDDEERLFNFLESSYRKYGKPVHILYAGRPHPNNYPGRSRIRKIVEISERLAVRAKERDFRAQIIFIQGYDIDLARYLVPGVDVWLNNPIRPMEASGTSGMKAGMNGVLNLSVPDGWVPEGIRTGENGWMFGQGGQETEEADRQELYNLLENEILPAYFAVGEDKATYGPDEVAYSPQWVGMMKNSIHDITKQFNTDRMLCDYIDKIYAPAAKNFVANANLEKSESNV